MQNFSLAPDGTEYHLPTEEQSKIEREEILRITEEQRKLGRKIVTVQGMGFVGCVMAVVVADSENDKGESYYYVHGHQRISKRSFWKVPVINTGVPPVSSSDHEVPELFDRCVNQKKNFRATWHNIAYEVADVVVVDIQLDATKPAFGEAEKGYCDITHFRDGMRTLGQHIRPDCLILVETTVPPGTCDKIVKPIIEEEFVKRGIDIKENELDNTNSSEMSKVMENSYRATNIALTLEWARFAEKIGVDIFKVRDAIRMRKGTHDNLLRPSLGVGGYCLTKDPVLANWSMKDVFEIDDELSIAVNSVNVNDTMPTHTVDLIKEEIPELRDVKITVLGVSYLEDVGDTRHSPSFTLVRLLRENWAEVVCHDMYVEFWAELETEEVYNDLDKVLKGAEVVIIAVGHTDYKTIEPAELVAKCGTKPLIIDCSNFLDDEKIKQYKDLGCKVKGVGKGHIAAL